jgi:hypothetical protein
MKKEQYITKDLRALKTDRSIEIAWVDETKKEKFLGYFHLFIKEKEKEAIIFFYRKNYKSIDGYYYIKKSIDFILDLGYNIVSLGHRFNEAIGVWKKIENDYIIESRVSEYGDSEIYNIKKIINKKLIN